MKVKYDYTFIFDPSETWSHKNEIDSFLASALNEIGLQAERVDNYGKGGEVLLIKRVLPPAKAKVQQTDNIKDQKSNLIKKAK